MVISILHIIVSVAITAALTIHFGFNLISIGAVLMSIPILVRNTHILQMGIQLKRMERLDESDSIHGRVIPRE